MAANKRILIGLIARREAAFYRDLLPYLKLPSDCEIIFVAFHAACKPMLQHTGLKVYDFHEWKKKFLASSSAIDEAAIEKKYGMSVKEISLHEALTHAINDHNSLAQKISTYLRAMEALVDEVKPTSFIMELGGFIANVVPYLVCRSRGITHYTIEPAFFPKRCFWVKDSLYAAIPEKISEQLDEKNYALMTESLQEMTGKKIVNKPDKDRHHFMDMNFKKIFTKRNISRLSGKLLDKYVRGYEEEYNAIFNVLRYNYWKLMNRRRNEPLYSTLEQLDKPFVYYPLHVPLDVQLTVRCSQFLDQGELIAKIIDHLDKTLPLVIKEHPASIGAYDFSKLQDFIQSKQLILLHPSVSSYDIIDRAKYILTVNSKVGIEAILRGKATVVLGKAIYRGQSISIDINTLDNLPQNGAIKPAVEKSLDSFLRRSYNWSLPGELYEHSQENVRAFAESLEKIVLQSN